MLMPEGTSWSDQSFGETVKFEDEGDMIEGYVSHLEVVETQYGEAEVLNLENPEEMEKYSVFMTTVQLKNWLDRVTLQPGDIVGIRYDGKQGSMKLFSCYHVSKESDDYVSPEAEVPF